MPVFLKKGPHATRLKFG